MIDFHCTIRVFVDKDDKVAHYDFTGNVGGCGRTRIGSTSRTGWCLKCVMTAGWREGVAPALGGCCRGKAWELSLR